MSISWPSCWFQYLTVGLQKKKKKKSAHITSKEITGILLVASIQSMDRKYNIFIPWLQHWRCSFSVGHLTSISQAEISRIDFFFLLIVLRLVLEHKQLFFVKFISDVEQLKRILSVYGYKRNTWPAKSNLVCSLF